MWPQLQTHVHCSRCIRNDGTVMKKPVAVVALAFGLSLMASAATAQQGFLPTAVAGEHLVPERSVFADTFLLEYDTMVVSALEGAFTRDVRVRAVVQPSFQPEYAVGVKERENGFRVFCLHPEIQLWAYETLNMMKAGSIRNLGSIIGPPTDRASETPKELEKLEASLPANFRDVKIKSGDAEIASDLARLLVAIWETMLRQTRYDKAAHLGFDGVSYHFSMRSDHQNLAGYVWSPPPASTTELLVKVVETMRLVCDSDVSDIGDHCVPRRTRSAVDCSSRIRGGSSSRAPRGLPAAPGKHRAAGTRLNSYR